MSIYGSSRAGAVAVLVGVIALVAAACGGGGGEGDEPPQAEELVPDLDDMGMTVQQEGAVIEDANTYRVIFAGESSEDGGVLTDIRVMENSEVAETEFARLAEALQNPPDVFLGAEATQETTDPIDMGDDQVAYVTADPDSAGNRVWTDLYRSGAVLLITQTLSADEEAALATRQEVADRVLSEVE